jgi:TATA-box binding protein (TBP) (component of TFIID and TFIIIB)
MLNKKKMFEGVLKNPELFPVPLETLPSFKSNIVEISNDYDEIPRVVNIVTTIHYLPIDESSGKREFYFPLNTLSALFPCCQFKPRAFASLIIRMKDGDSEFTGLFFGSGKGLFVKCTGPFHSMYLSQEIRLALGEIPICVKDVKNNTIIEDKLGKYINFKQWKVQNIVLTANLGFKVNLELLATTFQDKIKYNPTDFPGAQCIVSVKSKNECTCTKKAKCGCLATIIVFEQGAVIIGGTKTVREGNFAYYRFKAFLQDYKKEDFEILDKERYRNRIKNFQKQIQSINDQDFPENVNYDLSPEEEEEGLRIAIQSALNILKLSKYTDKVDIMKNLENGQTYFDLAVETGQLQNVYYLVENGFVDNEEIQSSLEKNKRTLSEVHPVVRYLEKKQKK